MDYSYVEKVKQTEEIEDEDAEEEQEPAEDDEEEKPVKKETIFLAGRLYREDTEIKQAPAPAPKEGEEAPAAPDSKWKTKWIYEKWNKVVNSADFSDVPATMGQLLKKSRQEIRSNKDRVKEAKSAVIKAAEEKRALLAAAAAKKTKAAKKGGKAKQEEAPVEDEEKREVVATA